MGVLEIIIVGIGLGMDSFAVSICKGLSLSKMSWKKAVIIGLYFGFFQAAMPTIGFFMGKRFENAITSFDHWIAFVLLAAIGVNMIREALKKDNECSNENVNFKEMLPLAIATSIDALAVGITFAFLKVNILLAIILIGVIAFLVSVIGVRIGNMVGDKYKAKAEVFGGAILILMGIKILIEHLL